MEGECTVTKELETVLPLFLAELFVWPRQLALSTPLPDLFRGSILLISFQLPLRFFDKFQHHTSGLSILFYNVIITCETKVIDLPALPALAVLPTRWM